MTSLLQMRNFTAGYTSDIDILQNVDIDVEVGQVVGLIGLNGAGKSTVMKAICGFLAPKQGSVHIGNQDITGAQPHQMLSQGICLIPQESSLFQYMTVEENLLLPGEHLVRLGSISRQTLTERLEDTYERFPVLKERRKEAAGNFSGGQQKMLEFAKAYLIKPRLCLIDEPSIGLSPKVAAEVYEWIGLFSKSEMGILLVDHNIRKVLKMSDFIYVLTLGQVSAKGGREDFESDLHEQVRKWMGITF